MAYQTSKKNIARVCRDSDSICEKCAKQSGACEEFVKSINAKWKKGECEVCGDCKAVTNGKSFYWPDIERKDFTDW